MKKFIALVVIFLFSANLHAQLDRSKGTSTTVKGLGIPVKPDMNGLPAPKTPSLSNLNKNGLFPVVKDSITFSEEKKPMTMTTDNGLMEFKQQDFKPKAFKDKDIKESYRSDQYLGDFKTGGKFVEVYCRDHEYVDGDKVRIYVNGEVVQSSISLGASYTPVLIKLKNGFNNIEFEALNQGTSGPNTAELRVLDENGQALTLKEWNLLTGAKASIIVVKQ